MTPRAIDWIERDRLALLAQLEQEADQFDIVDRPRSVLADLIHLLQAEMETFYRAGGGTHLVVVDPPVKQPRVTRHYNQSLRAWERAGAA